MSPRRLLLMRHGRTAHNQRGIWQGHLDVPLDETGRAQATRAAAAVAAYRPAFVISSDLSRAHHTARAIAVAAGCHVEVDPRLREIHIGSWQGRSNAEIVAEEAEVLEALHAGEDPRRGGNGETVAEVVERARPALQAALARLRPQQTGVLVSHGITTLGMAADTVGIEPRTASIGLSTLGNCCWGVLEERPLDHSGRFSDSGPTAWRLAGWNLSAPDLGIGTPSG